MNTQTLMPHSAAVDQGAEAVHDPRGHEVPLPHGDGLLPRLVHKAHVLQAVPTQNPSTHLDMKPIKKPR